MTQPLPSNETNKQSSNPKPWLLKHYEAKRQRTVTLVKATVDQLDGTVRNDQATVENAKLNLAYCHITAPVNGRIGLRLVDPGSIVHASDANPMRVLGQLHPTPDPMGGDDANIAQQSQDAIRKLVANSPELDDHAWTAIDKRPGAITFKQT